MGNDAYFMSFKGRSEGEVISCLSQIGKERLDGVSVSAIACFHKNIGGIKKGECYAMSYGDRYVQRYKEFLEGVEGLSKRDCKMVLGETIYDRLSDYSDIEKYATIKPVEWYNPTQLVLFEEPTKEEEQRYHEAGIVRRCGDYLVLQGTLNSDDYDETKPTLTYEKGDAYYDFQFERLKDTSFVRITNYKNSYSSGSQAYVHDDTSEVSGFVDFEEEVRG